MAAPRAQLVREAASRGKYAPLYRHLSAMSGSEWRATFAEIEAILGFALPNSARLYRPWWSNQEKGTGHSHALAWQVAGWKTREVDLEAETLVFARRNDQSDGDVAAGQPHVFSIAGILPPHDPGQWPEGFTVSRDQLYNADGR